MSIFRIGGRLVSVLALASSCTLHCLAAEQKAPADAGAHSTSIFAPNTLLVSARDAIECGLPSLAETIADDFFKQNISSPKTKQMRAIMLDALIAQGKFKLAKKYLADEEKETNKDKLRRSMVLLGLGEKDEAKKILAKMQEPSSNTEKAWYYMARGIAAKQEANNALAMAEFERAKKFSPNTYLSQDAEIAIAAIKILDEFTSSEDGKKLESELSQKVDTLLGTPEGFRFAKRYIALLLKLGKTKEALDVINTQLSIELSDELDKDELRLMSAAINLDEAKRDSDLKEILKNASSATTADYALALLAKNSKVSPEERKTFLAELASDNTSPIRDRILLALAKLCVRTSDYAGAEDAAKKIIVDFPSSEYAGHALRILAWIAFRSDDKKAPEYRLAATYLKELAKLEFEKDKEKAARIGMLAADCYFLNRDYEGAAKIYENVILSDVKTRADVLERAVKVFVQLGRNADAIKLITHCQEKNLLTHEELWQAAWHLISQYKKDKGSIAAAKSIDNILSKADGKITPKLKTKILWTRARIVEEVGDNQKLVKLCQELDAEITAMPAKDLSPEIKTLHANVLLMQGRALERLNKIEGELSAFASFKKLRKLFPQSEASQMSSLAQARILANLERYDAARKVCLELAEKSPKGKYTYDALYDAAEYSRRMGLEQNFRAALRILDDMQKRFPKAPRNFYAKISQAEILRLLGAFADARAMYNDAINSFPEHAELYIAFMGIGDSSAALSATANDAAATFERVYALPNIPPAARAEAAHKWAFALERAGKPSEADEVRWVTSRQLIKDSPTDAASRYWIGRTLFDLGRALELSGRTHDAHRAYELIVEHNLPSAKIAKDRLQLKQNNKKR